MRKSLWMKRYGFLLLLVLLIGAAFSQPALADTVYTYTGNSFNSFDGLTCPPHCAISGSFTLASPLPDNLGLQSITPLAFSFTDGSITITNLTAFAGGDTFEVGTNSSGEITSWGIQVTDTSTFTDALGTFNNGIITFDRAVVGSTGGAAFPRAAISNDPGVWTSATVAAPEPSSIALMLLGVGLVFVLRKRMGQRLPQAS